LEQNSTKENYNNRGNEIRRLDQEIDKLKTELNSLKTEKTTMLKKIVEMENEITILTDQNRELEYKGIDFESKFYSLLEEKITNDNEYQEFTDEKNDCIERLRMEINEINQENEMKEEILRCLKKQIEDFENKEKLINNNDINKEDNKKNVNINKRESHLEFESNKKEENLNIDKITIVNNNEKLEKINNKGNKSSNNASENEENYNKSYSHHRKKSQSYTDDDLNELNPNAISAKIDQVLNYSIRESVFISNFMDRSGMGKNSICENINKGLNTSDENEEKEYIRNIIDSEVKNILENRKEFILKTLAQENFNIDFICSKINSNSSKISIPERVDNSIKKKYPNKTKIIESIDEILIKIQNRREKVLNQKKLMMVKLEKMGIKIF
jgi:hypothetical protein